MPDARFFDLERTFVQPVELIRSSTALLIIDMQYHDASPDSGFNLALDRIDPGCMDYFNERTETVVIPTIRTLLEHFRANEMRVIYLTLGSDYRDLRDVPLRLRRWIRQVEEESGIADIFWSGNPAFAIRREIEPRDEETVVNKTTFGAFNGSMLEQVLRELGVESLIVTGISTNCCVETTTRDAADLGFGCVVVDEGTADYDAEAHDAALRALYFSFARILGSAEDVVAALEEAHV